MVGLAPTNAVAQDLKADGFREASTVHSALFSIKNGRGLGWDKHTVLIVDEAAMLDTRITGELLAEARVSGAKVILAGDDRQLASIERGGMFTELRKAHGAAEITEVTRQRTGWQRQLRAAPDQVVRGKVWQAVEKSGAVAGELGTFRGAVERRFGAEGVREMLRAEGRAGAVSAPSVAAGQRAALDQVAERISTMWSGEKAVSLAQHQAEREQLGLRQGPRMQM